MAVRAESPDCWLDDKQTFLVRIATKTDECISVDGLDVLFVVEADDTIIAPEFFENSPSFIGGPLEEGRLGCSEAGVDRVNALAFSVSPKVSLS